MKDPRTCPTIASSISRISWSRFVTRDYNLIYRFVTRSCYLIVDRFVTRDCYHIIDRFVSYTGS